MFPIPNTSAIFRRPARQIDPACAGLMRLRADRLTVAPHNPITRDARTVEVTSFQKWFRFIETRHLERCRFPAQRRRLDGANLFRIRRVQATEIPAVRLNSLRKPPGGQLSDRRLQRNFAIFLMDFRGGNRYVPRGERTLLKAVT